MENIKQFKNMVRYFVNPKDYKENKSILKSIKPHNRELFVNVLKCGAEIVPSLRIVDDISKITAETNLTQDEALKILLKSLLFNFYLNVKQY